MTYNDKEERKYHRFYDKHGFRIAEREPTNEDLRKLVESFPYTPSYKRCVIMRGLSGCGKTSYVNEQLREDEDYYRYCSADKYFINNETGEYEFNPRDLSKAHEQCMSDFIEAVFNPDVYVVVVDNTNSQHWEFRNYWELAMLCGYEVDIIHVKLDVKPIGYRDLKLLSMRNTHGVPFEVIKQMSERWQDIDGERIVQTELTSEDEDLLTKIKDEESRIMHMEEME